MKDKEEETTIRIKKSLKKRIFETKGDEINYNDFISHLLDCYLGIK